MATHLSRDSFKVVAGNAKPPLGECLQLSTLPSWGSAFPVICSVSRLKLVAEIISYWLNTRKWRIGAVMEPEVGKETQSPLQRDAYMDVGSRAPTVGALGEAKESNSPSGARTRFK
ncbi:MAG: hypothetical protein Q8L79_07385 [Methylobacter sp.]|uniref:hypothetical protein n=1 Tax=Methylobacter sp. TaxID=2051955 RepID=UPI0027315F77|nr:hypothetical protein [Methylobacter sp.]MDP1664936.1 hypothetical protein [Methylobacter sp.]